MAALEGNCLLKISNSEHLNKFLHECVDDLIGRKHESALNYTSDIEWTPGEKQKARLLIQNLYKRGVQEEEIILKLRDLSTRDEAEIKECFEIRKGEIYQAVVKEKLLQTGHPLVENIDWKLKWVMGSSKLASLSEPLLQVDLHCLKNEGEGNRSTINFEMSLDKLDKLIGDLENVKANLL